MIFMNIITVGSLAMILYITPIANFFKVEPLNFSQLVCTAVSVVAVLWIEIYKWNRDTKQHIKRVHHENTVVSIQWLKII
jgi:Ca2+-transporting ATPase